MWRTKYTTSSTKFYYDLSPPTRFDEEPKNLELRLFGSFLIADYFAKSRAKAKQPVKPASSFKPGVFKYSSIGGIAT